MPVIDLTISDLTTNVIQNIANQTVNSVLHQMGFQNYFPANLNIKTDWMDGALSYDENNNPNLSRDKCDVNYTVDWNPAETKWDVLTFRHTQAYGVITPDRYALRPVLADYAAEFKIIEHFVPCSINFDFSMQFKNRESAFLAMQVLSNISLKSSVFKYHDIAYEYPIGIHLYAIIHQIYTLRKSVNATVDFNSYLTQATFGAYNKVINKDLTSNNDGGVTGVAEAVIKKSGTKALGLLEFTQVRPEVQLKNNVPDRFVVNFTYTLQFNRPDSHRIHFPVVVENQLIPASMVVSPATTGIVNLMGVFQEQDLFAALKPLSGGPTKLALRFPYYDDWILPNSMVSARQYNAFFIATFTLDTNEDGTIKSSTTINLNELDTAVINPTVLNIIAQHGRDIFINTGLYNVSVFANNLQLDPSYLTIDDNLNVTVNFTNPILRYHLVIYEATDIPGLDPKWIDTIIANRTFFPATIMRHMQHLINKGIFYVDNSNAILNWIRKSILNRTLRSQIDTLITNGHTGLWAYYYTATEWQFASFLMNNKSLNTDKILYDEYVAQLITANDVTTNQLPSGYIRTRKGYPILGDAGGVPNNFNLPLRVWDVRVPVSRKMK